MSEPVASRPGLHARDPTSSAAAGCVVFARAGRRFALQTDAVEAVAPPPILARIPHAGPSLLGAGNLGGHIAPVIDLAHALGCGGDAGAYDGSGEVLRVRTPAGRIGIWVERVDGLAALHDCEDLADITVIDPAALPAGLNPPSLAAGSRSPLGDPEELVPMVSSAPAETFILVETAGEAVRLRRDDVIELIEAVSWTPVPRAPRGLLGVAVLRGNALPILSLAMLLDLEDSATPGAYLAAELRGEHVLVAVDRILGLRSAQQASARRWATLAGGDDTVKEAPPIDLATLVPAELQRIAAGFAGSNRRAVPPGPAFSDSAAKYLAFSVAGQDFAVPVTAVDRIVDARPEIRLPLTVGPADRTSGMRVVGAIELRGQIVPVIALGDRLLPDAASQQERTGACAFHVVLRDAGGLAAIGVDRVMQLVALTPEDVSTPSVRGLLSGVASLPTGGLLRLLRPEFLWVRD